MDKGWKIVLAEDREELSESELKKRFMSMNHGFKMSPGELEVAWKYNRFIREIFKDKTL